MTRAEGDVAELPRTQGGCCWALAVVLSVAFVAGSLILSDVTVRPVENLNEAVPSGSTATVPAALADRVAGLDGVAAAQVDAEVENLTVVDDENEPVGPTTGAAWDPPTAARSN